MTLSKKKSWVESTQLEQTVLQRHVVWIYFSDATVNSLRIGLQCETFQTFMNTLILFINAAEYRSVYK